MNKLKQRLHKLPFIKKIVKKLYLYFHYYTNMRSSKLLCGNKVTCDNLETFFGYYDKSPENETGEFLIYQITQKSHEYPSPQKKVQVVLQNVNDGKCTYFDTRAYNWQQGAKLMWVDKYKFIFNDYDFKNNIYISKLVDALSLKIVCEYDFPIYDSGSEFAYTLSFEKLLEVRPDYCYRNIRDKNCLSNIEDDGIFLCNLNTNSKELIISISNIIELHYNKTMDQAKHWFNHIMIGPKKDKFIFLHRWESSDLVKFDALILSDKYGNNIKCLVDDGMVSHCYWRNNDEIIAYMRTLKSGDKYYNINVNSGEISVLGEGIIDKFGDGHPVVYNDIMYFDTYPDKSRYKQLYSYDLRNSELKLLGDFFEPIRYYEESRCDLHPKISLNGKSLYFDSTHENKRLLYKLSINE
jgi:hypothetical protein